MQDTIDINDTCVDFNTTIDGSIFDGVIKNHCFTQEIENDFICTPQFYRENNPQK